MKLPKRRKRNRGGCCRIKSGKRTVLNARRPLWLTETEAETLLSLTLTSAFGVDGDAEVALFDRLRGYLRRF